MDNSFPSETADVAVPGGSPAVRDQIERLCQSAEFVDSPRAEEFLRYVVEETLAGRSRGLSQRTIAHGVYGRDGDFDPAIDPLVRMQAQRVRRSLEHYYLTDGQHDSIEVRLPKGGYHPEFKANGHAERVPAHESDGMSMLMVPPFQNHTGNQEFEFLAQGLASDLAVALDRYQVAQVLLLPDQPAQSAAVKNEVRSACQGACCYLVTGKIGSRSGGIRIAVHLQETSTRKQVWAHEESFRDGSDGRDRFLDEFVERVAASIAEEQGMVAQRAIGRLESRPPVEASAYEALLHLYHAERCSTLENYEKALRALQHAVQVAPEDGRLWTGLARVCALNHMLEVLPTCEVPIGDAIQYAEKGVRYGATDQRAWCMLAFAHTMAGHLERGREATLRALAQNPDSLFFRDVVGYLLILQGDWERGAELSREAVRLNPFVRDSAFAGLWLDAFRREDFEEAHSWCERFLELNLFWSPLMRAATLARLERKAEAQSAIHHLLLLRPDFRESGSRLIRRSIQFEELACRVEQALRMAGLEFTSAG